MPAAFSPAGRNAVRASVCLGLIGLISVFNATFSLHAQNPSPSTYTGYTGTNAIVPPPAPALGTANSAIADPTFGSRILRVTDGNTAGGQSFIPADSGFTRTFNADSTAIKLQDPQMWGYWLEFDPSTMKVGDGSARPALHAITAFDARWEWSAVDPNTIYYLRGSKIGRYNKSTGAITDLAGPSNGDPVTYHAAVVGQDAWVCSAAGAGQQDTYTEIFCVNPNSSPTTKLIDIPNKLINGVPQTDPNWPTSASGQTIGIHSLYGSSAGTWLGVTFHGQSWGGNGDAVLNLSTNTWSRVTNGDYYWSGHISLGNGKFVNGSGSIDGKDSRGAVIRDANDLMNSAKYQFIMQPSSTCCWNDAEHSSWFNSANNASAPVLFSRYTGNKSPWLAWMSEIVLAATDGSNTVWRFAHTHEGGCYYGYAFAQISNDGRWALFSSPWDGTLGGPAAFGCGSRIDTFIVELAGGSSVSPSPTPSPSPSPSPSPAPTPAPTTATTVQWTNLVNAAVSGTVLQKTGGCDGCGDAGAISQQQIPSGDGYTEFTASEANTLRGLGLNAGNPGTDLRNFAYSLRLQSGIVEVRETGVYRADTTYATGDLLRIAVVSGRVCYSKNGNVFYTSTLAPVYPLLAAASLVDAGSTIADAVIAASSTTTTTADTTPPVVSISSPSNGATLSGNVSVSATASDDTGVSKVQFTLDGANLGSALTATPYTIAWNTTSVADGTHTLAAIASDAAGNVSKSAAVSIAVANTPALTVGSVSVTGVTTNAATIQWTTNLAASSEVQYGTTTAYGSSSGISSTLVTSHSMSLSGLAPRTTYHYRVASKTAAQTVVSADFSFTTASKQIRKLQ